MPSISFADIQAVIASNLVSSSETVSGTFSTNLTMSWIFVWSESTSAVMDRFCSLVSLCVGAAVVEDALDRRLLSFARRLGRLHLRAHQGNPGRLSLEA